MLERLPHGPAAVFLEGVAGIGKTTLLDAVASQATDRGIRVLRCRPTQSEVRLTHGGLIELLDGLGPALVATLPPPQERALRLALRWDEPEGHAVERQTVAAAVTSVLRAKAREGPLLLAVDDLHWLDDSTANALEYALRRLGGQPVGVIGAARTHEGDRPRPTERAFAPERVERHQLGPLEPAAIRMLIADRLNWQLSPRDAGRIADASGGNPFVALEVARTIHATGMPPAGQRLPVPEDVREMIVRRLDRLRDDTRRTLVEVAAGGVPTVPPLDATALASAERAGIVRVLADGRVVFQHPLFESAVYEATPLAERRAVHARLAADESSPEGRARHLALAAIGPDVAVADALEHAAGAAAARGDASTAFELAELAWRTTPSAQVRHRGQRVVAAARYALVATLPGDAIRVVDDALPLLSGSVRGRALLIRAEAFVWARPVSDAIPVFRAALAELDDDDANAAAALLGLTFALHQSGAPPQLGVEAVDQALVRAERSGEPSVVAEALAVRTMVRFLAGEGLRTDDLDRARTLQDHARATPAHYRPDCIWATIVGYCDELLPALDWFVAEIDAQVTTGLVGDVLYMGLHASTLAIWAGRPALARHVIEISALTAEDMGGAFALISGRHLGILKTAVVAGDLDHARAVAGEGIRLTLATGSVYAGIWLVGEITQCEIAAGNPREALEWIRPVLEAPVGTHPPDPAALFFLPDAIEALIGVGELRRARGMLDAYQARSVELGRRWCHAASLRCRALLEGAEGHVDHAVGYAREAVAISTSLDYVVEHARNNLVLGQLLRRQRQRGAARAALEMALELFEQAEHRLWIQRARDELSRAWPRRSDGELTTAEARIAGLVASGMTNGEVAVAVFVSRRTVEATLSRVYRKLGVRNRSELTARWQERGDLADSGIDGGVRASLGDPSDR